MTALKYLAIVILLTLAARVESPAQSGDMAWSSPSGAASSPLAGHWDHPFGIPGVDGTVYMLANMGDTIIAGGDFHTAGSRFVENLAFWDGNQWHPMLDSRGKGVSGVVYALAVEGSSVYVGGEFSYAGEHLVRNIVRWDMTDHSWHPLGEGIGGIYFGRVYTLLLHRGMLYAGGKFIVAGTSIAVNVAGWDGSRWHRLGSGVNAEVRALTGLEDEILVGGKFVYAGDKIVTGLARWAPDADEWRSIPFRFDDIDPDRDGDSRQGVLALAYADGSAYIGGNFRKVNGEIFDGIVRWPIEETTVERVGSRTPGHRPNFASATSIHLFNGRVYCTGGFASSNVEGDNPPKLGYLENDQWHLIGPTPARYAFPEMGPKEVERNDAKILTMAFNTSGDLFVGGWFELIGDETALINGYSDYFRRRYNSHGVAMFRDGRWNAVGTGINGEVRALHSVGNTLMVAGQFNSAGADAARNIAAWDVEQHRWRLPTTIRELPEDLRYNTGTAASAVTADDSYVYVATELPGTIQAWNRETGEISEIPHPFPYSGSYPSSRIYAMAAIDGNLVVAGSGGVVVRSNGIWSPVIPANGPVHAVLVHEGDLYVAGGFSEIGTIRASGIARFRLPDMTVSELAEGLTGEVRALAHDGSRLYAAGHDIGPDGEHVMSWDGEEWRRLPNAPGPVNTLAVMHGRLFAGGTFRTIGGDRQAPALAQWDGTTWYPLEQGLEHLDPGVSVNSLAVIGDTLYVGGLFMWVSGQPEYYLSRWVATGTLSAPEGRVAATGAEIAASSRPNPFTAETLIEFTLPKRAWTRLTIYRETGERVETLLQQELAAGTHRISWTPSPEEPSGRFIYHLQSGDAVASGMLHRQR